MDDGRRTIDRMFALLRHISGRPGHLIVMAVIMVAVIAAVMIIRLHAAR